MKLDTPTELPRILGPRKLPSNCCRMIIKIIKYSACSGFTTKIRKTDGTAPMNGPKNGITLVIPTKTEISTA